MTKTRNREIDIREILVGTILAIGVPHRDSRFQTQEWKQQ